ncbi:Panacea domain-containing protein [Alicyclobacillus dauci]|uniref:DUF4065 domain-containing protein n=1 Tax=Alicyclobacillus dauci TaxID=1475485 RepID=A0ABY6YYK3_9BACL|nr:type II toxin-antitoxin system antitoxin SocA domain-containing protein [Alicyclobacillus dauci]WAH35066.1 DUF4065 domain-containing protein [Alicyclobacillus dauci]
MAANVSDVASFFITRASRDGRTISNMKLQKLCFYAQAIHLARHGKPLVDVPFKAWKHGPVCPEIYHEYKVYGRDPIPAIAGDGFDALGAFDGDQFDSLIWVWDRFGDMSAIRLRNLTHAEDPWRQAYGHINDEISTNSMYAYYSNKFGEVDEYDSFIQNCQDELNDEIASGQVISEPTDDMVYEMKSNHELTKGIARKSLDQYLKQVDVEN